MNSDILHFSNSFIKHVLTLSENKQTDFTKKPVKFKTSRNIRRQVYEKRNTNNRETKRV